MWTSESLYKLSVDCVNGKHLELIGYEEVMNLLAFIAKTTGKFSNEDVSHIFPLECLKNHQLITHNLKLMIWGAGRAGTTFLVQLLTRLDFFTGYVPYKEGALNVSEGGCEFGIQTVNENVTPSETFVLREFERSPFILKVLIQGYLAKKVIFHYQIPIGHILVPVRFHEEVAHSRLGESIPWEFVGATQNEQIFAADVVLGRVVEAAVLADIPLTFVRFPDIVKDEEYCWKKVSPVFSNSFNIQLDRERFREEFHKLSDFSLSKYSKENQNNGIQRRH